MSNEKIKVFYVEATDPYRETNVVDGRAFFDESQADALEKEKQEKNYPNYAYMVQEIYAEFAHRNGESEPPKIDGWYWVLTPASKQLAMIFLYGKTFDPHLEHVYGWGSMKYYGPIPMPEPV